ncbi:MAG: RNA recognition motif domain-containing protein [Candidatus Binatia bacterium]
MGRKLYVGNLSFEVTTQDLEQLFTQSGVCDSVALVTDRETGRSRGFAFVEMGSNREAQEAIQRFDGQELKGRAIRVSEAHEQRRGGGGGRGGFRGGNRW